MHNRICQRYETEPTPREANNEEQIDLEPRAVDSDYAKTAKRATSSRRLGAKCHRESRDADSESFRTGITCQNGGKWTILHYQGICYGWKHLSTPVRWEKTGPRNSQHLRLQAFLNDHVKIGPVTGIEDSKSAGTLVIEVHKLKNTHDNSFLKILNTKILEPCFRRRQYAAGDREHKEQVDIRQSDIKLRQSQSPDQLVSVNEFGNQSTKKDSEFVRISKHFTKILRRTGCHESKDQYDGIMFWQACQVLSKTQNWNKRKLDWCAQSFYWQTQNEELWGSKRNDVLHSCITRTQSWCYNQSNPILKEIPLRWKEHVYSKRIFLPTINQSSRMLHRQED